MSGRQPSGKCPRSRSWRCAPPAAAGRQHPPLPPAALDRLRFIKRAQSLGFPLDDVHALLRLQGSQATCDEARAVGEHQLQRIRDQVRDLQALEAALTSLVAKCRGRRGRASCQLIAVLSEPVP